MDHPLPTVSIRVQGSGGWKQSNELETDHRRCRLVTVIEKTIITKISSVCNCSIKTTINIHRRTIIWLPTSCLWTDSNWLTDWFVARSCYTHGRYAMLCPQIKHTLNSAKWGIILYLFGCIHMGNRLLCYFYVGTKKLAFLFGFHGIPVEMSRRCHSDHVILTSSPVYTSLLPSSATEADARGGPDGVCYACFAVVRLLFIRHRGSSGRPPRRRLLFQSLRRREGEERAGDKNKCPY